MDFLKIFEGIEINEEQEKALSQFFKEYKEKLHKEFLESNTGEVDLEKYVSIEEAEKAFDLFEQHCEQAFEKFEEDAESAFNLFESHSERAFELFEEDAEKAFDLYDEDLKTQYTENMAKAIEEIYEDIEERVKKDFMESKEYKVFQNIKGLIIPLLENDDNELVAKLRQLNEEKEKVEQENEQLSKERTINTLLKDIPAEYVESLRSFIEKANSEDEIIERFNAYIEMLEIKEKTESSKFVRKQKIEKTITEEEIVTAEKAGAEHIFEVESAEVSNTDKKPISAFTESEEAALRTIGLA